MPEPPSNRRETSMRGPISPEREADRESLPHGPGDTACFAPSGEHAKPIAGHPAWPGNLQCTNIRYGAVAGGRSIRGWLEIHDHDS